MMNCSFQSEREILIVSPKPEDFSELKVKFNEKDSKIMYLAQIKGESDDNSYDTFVFYNKGNESYIFHEYENPAHQSYSTNIVVGNINDYWKKLAEMEGHEPGPFGKILDIANNYKELDLLLEQSQAKLGTQPKKQKM